MKKNIISVFCAYCLLPIAYSQIKVTKVTSQKITSGTGEVFINYAIEFKDKKNASVQIDSVKSIADASLLRSVAAYGRITFNIILIPPAKCKTCPETTPSPPNMTKGVIIYYKIGEKRLKCKVKKFEEMEMVMQP